LLVSSVARIARLILIFMLGWVVPGRISLPGVMLGSHHGDRLLCC
jgi:hypothetical protein